MLLPAIPLLLNALPSNAGGDAARPSTAAIALACTGCHGASGQGLGSIPALTELSEAEFVQRMKAFRDGQREATVMDRIARGYRDEDFAALAKLYNHR